MTGNTAYDNGDVGIEAQCPSTVTFNNASGNDLNYNLFGTPPCDAHNNKEIGAPTRPRHGSIPRTSAPHGRFSRRSSSGAEYAKLRIRLIPGSSTRGPHAPDEGQLVDRDVGHPVVEDLLDLVDSASRFLRSRLARLALEEILDLGDTPDV